MWTVCASSWKIRAFWFVHAGLEIMYFSYWRWHFENSFCNLSAFVFLRKCCFHVTKLVSTCCLFSQVRTSGKRQNFTKTQRWRWKGGVCRFRWHSKCYESPRICESNRRSRDANRLQWTREPRDVVPASWAHWTSAATEKNRRVSHRIYKVFLWRVDYIKERLWCFAWQCQVCNMYKKFVWMELPVSIYAFTIGNKSTWLLEDISLEYGSLSLKSWEKSLIKPITQDPSVMAIVRKDLKCSMVLYPHGFPLNVWPFCWRY